MFSIPYLSCFTCHKLCVTFNKSHFTWRQDRGGGVIIISYILGRKGIYRKSPIKEGNNCFIEKVACPRIKIGIRRQFMLSMLQCPVQITFNLKGIYGQDKNVYQTKSCHSLRQERFLNLRLFENQKLSVKIS